MRLGTRLALALGFLLPVAPAAAQFGAPVAPCPEGTGEATLRGINVEAALFTNGNLFFGNTRTNGVGYLVPLAGEDAGKSPLFAANLWLGGRVGGEARTAAARYGFFQLRPGLTGPQGIAPSPEACAEADRIWTLSTLEPHAGQLEDYQEWPLHLGAPVIDGDGIEGNYNLAAGDRPAIRGDAMAFWAMTDTATERDPFDRGNGEVPIGVDVLAEAFTFQALPTTTFYRFTMTNRNAVAIEDTYMGWYLDWDLGNASDDYVGTDTTNHMSFAFNESVTDAVYGVPPASGMVIARGPLADTNGTDDDHDGEVDEAGERMGMTAAPPNIKCCGVVSDPITPEEYMYRFEGRWNDGTPVYESGRGHFPSGSTAQTTLFAFPGDPTTDSFWSEVNIDGSGEDNNSGDRRSMLSTGPVRLEPGESMDAVFAIVFAQGEDHLDSVTQLRGQAEIIRRIADADAFGLRPFTYLEGLTPQAPPEITLTRPRPNPFTGTTTVTLSGASGANARVKVYDVLGRRLSVTEVTDAPEARVEVGAGLASGVYVVRVEGLGFAETFTIVKAR